MKEEQENFLKERYPKILKDLYIGVDDGWFEIINNLCYHIQSHVDRKREKDPEFPQVVAAQIKEKFGGLRFYVDNADDHSYGLISFAESMADVTCEHCGDKGKRRSGGWIVTLCDKCNGEEKK